MKQFLRVFVVVLILVIISDNCFAQTEKINRFNLTGTLAFDSHTSLEKYNEQGFAISALQLPERKSPLTAGLLSFVVPGAGQFYNGSLIKSIIFIAIEAAVITTAVIYNKKGNDKTTEFQNFADQHWDVKRYAQWTLDNLNHLAPGEDKNNYNVFDNNGNVVWSELNRLESAIGGGYSHNLPPLGEQQYYELIGKYPQYSHGWDDSKQSDTDFHILSSNFTFYSGQRGEANDLYNISAKAVIGIYINHAIAALEAVWGATQFNNNLSVNMHLNQVNLSDHTEYVPTMNLKFSF